jgi:NADH dehydrogenase
MAYLTALLFPRPLVSLGIAPASIARFSVSEEFAPPETA